jgi:small subunit ribosomal protein S1
VKKDGDEKEKNDKKRQEKDAKDDLKKAQNKVERSTLGDLDVFSELKEQMKEDENQDK